MQIGTQEWMLENLRTSKLNDGTSIPNVSDDGNWISITQPAYCRFHNDSISESEIVLVLYNWFAVNTGKLSPMGWHVPTDGDWDILINYLGGEEKAAEKLDQLGFFIGDIYGLRDFDGSFWNIGGAYWWSSTESNIDTNRAWFRCGDIGSSFGEIGIFKGERNKVCGFSVRCVRD